MSSNSERRILRSWQGNAAAWTNAVRKREIESRRLVTDAAIVAAIRDQSPQSVLDIGCGEGWLARELHARGMHVLGIDVIPGLVERARESGGGEFLEMSYDGLAAGKLERRFDAIVCNFSLLGAHSTEQVFRAAPRLLTDGGCFIVQTLHPCTACGELPYEDGWREGSWAGFSEAFTDPAPWYFRTLESWQALFTKCGFVLPEIREPLHPRLEIPASVIFIARASA